MLIALRSVKVSWAMERCRLILLGRVSFLRSLEERFYFILLIKMKKEKKMKKTISAIITLLMLTFALVSCFAPSSEPSASIWDDAIYAEDTAVGEGAITFTLDIEAAGKTVTLTVSTDKTVLGDALYELGLINDPSFFDVANGMLASWSQDMAYWGFYIGDTMASYGVSSEAVSNGNNYKFVYIK